MKDKTLEEVLALYEEVCDELSSRRYFEYLENIGKWVRDVPDPECPEKFPGAGMTVPIERMTEILAAIDAQKEYFKQYPHMADLRGIRITAEWSRVTGIDSRRISDRVKKGWSAEKILSGHVKNK